MYLVFWRLNYQNTFIKYFCNNELLLWNAKIKYYQLLLLHRHSLQRKMMYSTLMSQKTAPYCSELGYNGMFAFLGRTMWWVTGSPAPISNCEVGKTKCTVPSPAPVERLFSSGSLISTPRRNRLTDKRFEQLLLLKANNAVWHMSCYCGSAILIL